MRNRQYIFPLLLLLCAIVATAVLAQDEETLSKSYLHAPATLGLIISTMLFTVGYLLLYAVAVVITLSFMQIFRGLDGEMLLWIGLLWLGGMGANYLAYRITATHWLAALITMPILFGWSLLINTRPWADLTLKDAARVGVVVMLVCAPYFGPTWRINSQTLPTTESLRPPVVMPGQPLQSDLSRANYLNV